MKSIYKYTVLLVSLSILLLFAAYLLILLVKLNISFTDFTVLTLFFSLIAFVTLVIFFKGENKEPRSQTLYTLVAISLKFLLEITFALVWFIVAKKNHIPSVFMFFVLYLSLTLFSLWVILKTLKNKAL